MRGKRILINPIDDYCVYKGELFMAKKVKTYNDCVEKFEYKMSDQMAREMLKEREGNDFKMNPQDYLCKVVNETFGIKGTCVRVIRA